MNTLSENVQEKYVMQLHDAHRLAFFFWLSIGTQVFTDARDEIKDGIFANVEKMKNFKKVVDESKILL